MGSPWKATCSRELATPLKHGIGKQKGGMLGGWERGMNKSMKKKNLCMLPSLFYTKQLREICGFHSILHILFFSCLLLFMSQICSAVCLFLFLCLSLFNPSFHPLVVHSSVLMHDRKKADNDRYMTSIMTFSVKWFFVLTFSFLPDPL